MKGLIRGLSDTDYHKVLSPEEASYSSSQFKDALEDIEYFYKKYVSKEIVDEVSSTSQNNFDIGSAYHCKVLEPHKFDSSFAIYTGAVKRGKEYDAFCVENAGKTILTDKQMATVDFIVNANNSNEVAKKLLSKGEAEVSLFHEFQGLKVKVRADWIRFEVVVDEKGEVSQVPFILDLKSTTGNPKLKKDIQKKIESLHYDLSAALYMDVFNDYLAKNGQPLLEEWKFCFDSKDSGTSKVWTATKEMLDIGREKYMKALHAIKLARANNWVFKDEDSIIEPSTYSIQEWKNNNKPTEQVDEDLL